jgi:MYND finger
MASTSVTIDSYASELMETICSPTWFEMVKQGDWFQGGEAKPLDHINPHYQQYHSYACHSCKRGALTNTTVFTCTSCRVIRYCCKNCQKTDWKYHKDWCIAFRALRDEGQLESMTKYSSLEEWREDARVLTSKLSFRMKHFMKHSVDSQIIFAQPRCRKCFQAGTADASTSPKKNTFTACPKCMGVALCHGCVQTLEQELVGPLTPAQFHHDSANPDEECKTHLLSLCCSAMIVEQGNPLGLPSSKDNTDVRKPKDWNEYFSSKRWEYEIPEPMFHMAPVVAFLSEAHSHMLTLHHILGLPDFRMKGETATNLTKLVIHICGAAINDEAMTGRYVEMIRLNPDLVDFQIHLIGPTVEDNSVEHYHRVLAYETIRQSCKVTIQNHRGLYHEVITTEGTYKKGMDEPTIVLCPHAGMDDSSYTATWHPTIEFLVKRGVPIVVTGYTHQEVLDDTKLLREWGTKILVEPTANPWRGLRPYLDPSREAGDFIYVNASYVVAKGKA